MGGSFDIRRSQVVRAGRSPGVRGLVVWWEWSKATMRWVSLHPLSLLACVKATRVSGVPVIKAPGYRCGRARDAKRNDLLDFC